jgi:hypothetical protein
MPLTSAMVPASESRIHKTLRVTPAMEAGATERLWEVSDIVALVDAAEVKPVKRGPYKKRPAA